MNIIVACTQTIKAAESLILSCQRCNPASSTRFDTVLGHVKGRKKGIYTLGGVARCPKCGCDLKEATMVSMKASRSKRQAASVGTR